MGKYSKPQKSNKHKKIKFVDPFYHGERKERMFAGHNCDPTAKDMEQKLTRSQRDLFRSTKRVQELKNKSRREKQKILKEKMKKHIYTHRGKNKETFEEVPIFKQKKGENKSEFMNRVESETLNAVKEAQMIAKMKLTKGGRHEDKTENNAQEKSSKTRERLKLKKQLKKEKKKQKMEDRKDDFEHFRDKVEFGEVVSAPPVLTARPKNVKVSDRPAVNKLLLYNIINDNINDGSVNSKVTSFSSPVAKDKNKKALSAAEKRSLDKERQKVIDAYRQQKKLKS